MKKLTLYHGSEIILRNPVLDDSKTKKDFGPGLYLTEDKELASEWACRQGRDGYVNRYELDVTDLKVLDLNDDEHGILSWITLLLMNRDFAFKGQDSTETEDYMLDNFMPETRGYDVIIGYRADNSLFDCAKAFISNGISLEALKDVLELQEGTIQTVLVSPKALSKLEFKEYEPVSELKYYDKSFKRDLDIRKEYWMALRSATEDEGTFCEDIVREEINSENVRI